MNLMGEIGLSILLFAMMGFQGGAMILFTRKFLNPIPEGKGIVTLVNCWNTYVLLLIIPLIALLLFTGYYITVDITRIDLTGANLAFVLEFSGVLLIIYGTGLIVSGFFALRKNFQPGGFEPRSDDQLVNWGIYAYIQHPLYAGVLAMVLGLSLAVQSLFVAALFVVYLLLDLRAISLEETQLEKTFGEKYTAYREQVKRLVPFIY